jgi:hypothetical protein
LAPQFRGRSGYVELFDGKVKTAPAKTALSLAGTLPPLLDLAAAARAQRHESNDAAVLINHFPS